MGTQFAIIDSSYREFQPIVYLVSLLCYLISVVTFKGLDRKLKEVGERFSSVTEGRECKLVKVKKTKSISEQIDLFACFILRKTISYVMSASF